MTFHRSTFRRAARTVLFLIALLTLIGVGALFAQDQIPPSSVQTETLPVLGYPVTAAITAVEFTRDGMRVEFTKRVGPDSWPDVTPPGWDGPISYSVGVVFKVNSQWYADAPIEFWRDRKPDGAGPVTNQTDPVCEVGRGQFQCNWFYDRGKWPHLSQAHPVPGEQIGIFVTSGSVRNNAFIADVSKRVVQERSNIVAVRLPEPGVGVTINFDPGTVDPPQVDPPHVDPPYTDPPTDLAPLIERLTALEQQVNVLQARIGAAEVTTSLVAESLGQRLGLLESRPRVPIACKAAINVGTRIPISCSFQF